MIVLFSTPQVTALGTKFENVSKLFDHAAHNASNCLNSYCFVSLTLCMPAQKHDRISYCTFSLQNVAEKKSKLQLATSTLHQVMPEFP